MDFLGLGNLSAIAVRVAQREPGGSPHDSPDVTCGSCLCPHLLLTSPNRCHHLLGTPHTPPGWLLMQVGLAFVWERRGVTTVAPVTPQTGQGMEDGQGLRQDPRERGGAGISQNPPNPTCCNPLPPGERTLLFISLPDSLPSTLL